MSTDDKNSVVQTWDVSKTIFQLECFGEVILYEEILPMSKTLITRILHEYRVYMEEGDGKDGENVMCGNPFLSTIGPT